MKILNIAAGKQTPLDLDIFLPLDSPKDILNMDTCYFLDNHNVEDIETTFKGEDYHRETYFNYDVFEFMERTTVLFDHVVIYRYLEHISFTQINYFIYLISTILKKGCLVDIIVPDYKILGQMLMDDNPHRQDFEAFNILLTTELLNEPSCPHASIWTPDRAKYFWELEGRFKVRQRDIFTPYNFDGRNIYLRFLARRV